MSSRSYGRPRGVVTAVAAGVLTALVSPVAAGAATVSTTLDYTCRFPLLRPQPLSLKITAEIPTTVPAGSATGAFTIHAVADVNAAAARGLRAMNTATIEGSALAASTITLPGVPDPLELAVPTDITPTAVPATGGFATAADGKTPSVRFPQAGTSVITVGDVVLTLTPRMADGTKTGLDTFETECKQNPGQDATLARITVTSGGTPTATPVPVTPTATPTPVTPTPTPGTVSYGYGIAGSATLKTLTRGTVPLSGSAAAVLTLKTGEFSADLALNPSAANLLALNFLPVRASMAFVPQGPATGTLNGDGLTAAAKVRVKIPSVTLFGLQLAGGAGCQAKNPTLINLRGPDFDALSGGLLTGSFGISDLVNCGVLTGIVSPLTAGNGNAIALKLTSNSAA